MVKYLLTLLGKHLNGTKTSCFAVAKSSVTSAKSREPTSILALLFPP